VLGLEQVLEPEQALGLEPEREQVLGLEPEREQVLEPEQEQVRVQHKPPPSHQPVPPP